MSDEKAVAKVGGMGGLGDFTEDSLVATVETVEDAKGTATGESLRDAMGNQRPTLEQVKIKGHGANLFQFADGTKVDGAAGMTGVIVAYTRHNSFFGKPFGQSAPGELPACFSNDGETVAPKSESPQARGCAGCPLNRDARSAAVRDQAFETLREKGKDAVCTNYLSLAFALPGRELPVRIRFTKQSFRAWGDYVQKIGTNGRFLPHEVATRLKLKNVEGPHGEFSTAVFELVGPLPVELRNGFREQKKAYTALLQRSAEVEDRNESEGPSSDAQDALKQAKAQAAAAEEAGI